MSRKAVASGQLLPGVRALSEGPRRPPRNFTLGPGSDRFAHPQNCAKILATRPLLAVKGRHGKLDASCGAARGGLTTSVILKARSRAVSQTFDPAFRRVFNRSLLYSLVTFVTVWLASWFALDWAGDGLVAWVRNWAGDGFWVGVLQWLVDLAAIGAIAVASFFLFPAVMVTIMALLLDDRSEEHTSELQSLMRISYAVFCLKKKKKLK